MITVEHKGIVYTQIPIIHTNRIFSKKQIDKFRFSLADDGACLKNALAVAEIFNLHCVEGFVYCIATQGGKPDAKVIRHCWNTKDGLHFDVTKDFIWYKYPVKATDFHHFNIAEFQYIDYRNKLIEQKISFLSNVEIIAKEIDDELKVDEQNQ